MADVSNKLNEKTNSSSPSHINGRFAPGNKLGRGNPNNKRTHELRKLWLSCYSEADFREVYDRLLGMVREGDVAATKLWLEHGAGRPPQAVEVSGVDGESLSGLTPAVFAEAACAAIGNDPEARRRFALALLASGEGDR